MLQILALDGWAAAMRRVVPAAGHLGEVYYLALAIVLPCFAGKLFIAQVRK